MRWPWICRVFAGILPMFQSDLAGAQESKLVQLGALSGAVRRVLVEGGKLRLEDFFLAREPQHLRQGRIHLEEVPIARRSTDSHHCALHQRPVARLRTQ